MGALFVVFATEAAIRYWIELPIRYELERLADQKDVDRVRTALNEIIKSLARETRDYSQWDVTYNFLAADPASPESVYFREQEIGATAHQFNYINGIIVADLDLNVVYDSSFDLERGRADPSLAIDLATLDPGLLAQLRSSRSSAEIAGITGSNVGTIMLAAQHIVDTAMSGPPRGVLIFWRLIDDRFVREFSMRIKVDLELLPLDDALELALTNRLQQLQGSVTDFLPRDAQGNLYWLLPDLLGRPHFLVRQNAEARAFSTQLMSLSSLISIAVAAMLLYALTTYFARTYVRRVKAASAAMSEIRMTGKYDSRVAVEGGDELSELASHLNAMLERIQQQAEELRNSNEELARRSEYDSLTGIHNRGFFNDTLAITWRQAVRGRREISLVMLDVDYFKPFNDHYGHPAGDDVLRRIARTLEDTLQRSTDYVARYGGEEFGVILTDTDMDGAMAVAENLRRAVRSLAIPHGYSRCADIVTISCGVASMVADPADSERTLVQLADAALYEAKAAGRDRVVKAVTSDK